MNSTETKAKLEQAREQAQRLRRAADNPSSDVETLLDAETRAGAAERVVVRLELELEEAQSREKAEQERQEKEAAQARLKELVSLYKAGVDDLALFIDANAEILRPILDEVLRRRGVLLEMSVEHQKLFKVVTGESPDEIQRLFNHFSGPIPKFEHRLSDHDYSSLYGALITALDSAIGKPQAHYQIQARSNPDSADDTELQQVKLKAMGL